GKNEAERYAAFVSLVVTQGIRDIHVIPKVKHRIAAHVRRLLLLGLGARLSFEPQRRCQTPVWLVVLFNLSVYGPNGVLHLLVGELAVGVVNQGNDHKIASLKLLKFFHTPTNALIAYAFSVRCRAPLQTIRHRIGRLKIIFSIYLLSTDPDQAPYRKHARGVGRDRAALHCPKARTHF